MLRRPSALLPYAVSKKDIFYNDKLTIIGDIIILNDGNSTVLKPQWYFGQRMQIDARKDGKKLYRWVTLSEGLTDEYSTNISNGSCRPYWGDAKMINAATGRLEYLSPEWVKQQKWRKAFEELRSQMPQERNSWTVSKEMVQAFLDNKYK